MIPCPFWHESLCLGEGGSWIRWWFLGVVIGWGAARVGTVTRPTHSRQAFCSHVCTHSMSCARLIVADSLMANSVVAQSWYSWDQFWPYFLSTSAIADAWLPRDARGLASGTDHGYCFFHVDCLYRWFSLGVWHTSTHGSGAMAWCLWRFCRVACRVSHLTMILIEVSTLRSCLAASRASHLAMTSTSFWITRLWRERCRASRLVMILMLNSRARVMYSACA